MVCISLKYGRHAGFSRIILVLKLPLQKMVPDIHLGLWLAALEPKALALALLSLALALYVLS